MLCLEISINGQPYCRAGIGDEGVVSAFVSWVCFSPETAEPNLPVPPGSTLLSVTGFTPEQEAVHWGDVAHHLRVGDAVTIRIVEAPAADPYTPTPMLPPLDENSAEDSR